MEPCSPKEVLTLMARPRIPRNLQDRIIESVLEWHRKYYDNIDDYSEIGEYIVNGTDRKNVAGKIMGCHIIYVENLNCFLVYSDRTMMNTFLRLVDEGKRIIKTNKHGIKLIDPIPETLDFPKKCFAYTANEIVEATKMLFEDNFLDVKDEREKIGKRGREEDIDKALDKRDFTHLKLMTDIDNGMTIIKDEEE